MKGQMEHRTQNKFARALQQAIDESSSTRSEWASILGVTEPAISQWAHGDTIPRAEVLRSLWTTLLEDTRVSTDTLEVLAEVMRSPASKVSPRGERIGPSFRHYMVSPIRQGFLENLETLAPHDQEQVLLEASERTRQLRREGRQAPSASQERSALFGDLVDQELPESGRAGKPMIFISAQMKEHGYVAQLADAVNGLAGWTVVSLDAPTSSVAHEPAGHLRLSDRGAPGRKIEKNR